METKDQLALASFDQIGTELLAFRTDELFPESYRDFTEVQELIRVHNFLLAGIQTLILALVQERNIWTCSTEKLELFEEKLELAPKGDALERRAQILFWLSNITAFTEQDLRLRIQVLARGKPIDYKLDPRTLELELFQAQPEPEDPSQESPEGKPLLAQSIAKTIQKEAPANLLIFTGDRGKAPIACKAQIALVSQIHGKTRAI